MKRLCFVVAMAVAFGAGLLVVVFETEANPTADPCRRAPGQCVSPTPDP